MRTKIKDGISKTYCLYDFLYRPNKTFKITINKKSSNYKIFNTKASPTTYQLNFILLISYMSFDTFSTFWYVKPCWMFDPSYIGCVVTGSLREVT